MAWVSVCVIALLAGQVGIGKPEPTPAVRPVITDAPKSVSGTLMPNTEPSSPTLPPDTDALRGSIPREIPQSNPEISGARELPDATEILPPSTSSAEPPPANEPLSPPTSSDRAKNQAMDLVAQSLQIPPGGTIAGQPWALAQVLATSPDKKQQLLAVHSYWQLTEAVAKYHFAFEQAKQIEQLQSRPADDAALRAARTAASAMLRESELAVLSAQNDLAALVGLPGESPLPLPGDKPHVGGYRTNFQALFVTHSPPPIARVIDRTLPIRLTAIKERTASVQAAADSCIAAVESYQAGQTELAAVRSSGEQLLHEQRALIETVCRYNHDIAEYAFAVLGANISAQQLVAALIEPDRSAIEPRFSEKAGEVRPVEYLQPATPPGQINPAQRVPGQPTPALRPVKNPPSLAPVDIQPIPTLNHSAEKKSLQPLQRTTNKTIQAENDTRSFSPEPTATDARNVGIDKNVNSTSNASNTVAAGSGLNDSAVGSRLNNPASSTGLNNNTTALYSALIDATPTVRVKQLTLALHWDHSLPENSVKPMSLSECLAREAGGSRRETLAVYWIARQRAAEYQTIAQELEFLENLSTDALERRNAPAGAVEMLYLRAAQLSAKAALEESRAALVESQFELALRTQSTAEAIWPLASTPPHSGSYELNFVAQPRQLAQSRPMLKLSATIPALGVSAQEHAAAVVEADASRSAAIETYLAGAKPLGPALAAIAQQTRQTFSFLQTLTDYNRSIAEYSLSVLPSNLPAEKLAAALVVQP